MKYLFIAFGVLFAACTLRSQNPNCRPVIVARNGLSANLLPINTDADPETDGLGIRVKATDFVRSCSSPCGATSFKYRIRRAADGTGIPADSTLLFTCEELHQQEVEVWAIDPQGNVSYVTSYLDVQDNFKQCEKAVPPILPSCNQDGMAPTLLAIHGLALNIIPSPTGGTARVLASDFVFSKSDNCNGPIIQRIRKSGQGTGVPTTTALDFGCAELGQQEVEVWAGDLKGNWVYALSYVVLQDNDNSCDKFFEIGCSPDRIPVALEALNGLSAILGANGRVTLRVEDWVRKRTENCSVPVALRIRKVNNSLPGLPAPTSTTVEFTCEELGQQEVEIWSRDLAGNWSYTAAYVIVQDNAGVCGQMKGGASESRK